MMYPSRNEAPDSYKKYETNTIKNYSSSTAISNLILNIRL